MSRQRHSSTRRHEPGLIRPDGSETPGTSAARTELEERLEAARAARIERLDAARRRARQRFF